MGLKTNKKYKVQTKDFMQYEITIDSMSNGMIKFTSQAGTTNEISISDFNNKYIVIKEISDINLNERRLIHG